MVIAGGGMGCSAVREQPRRHLATALAAGETWGCACRHRTCADERSLSWCTREPAAWERRDGAISTPLSNTDDAVRRLVETQHPTCARWFHRAPARRVASERHMRSIFSVVGNVSTNQAQQVSWPEHDQVIESLASERAHEPFCEAVLPRGARSGSHLSNAEAVDPRASNTLPKMLSRSRIKRVIGGASRPSASTICCAAHAAWGCAVTFTWSTHRRSRDSTKKT